MKIVQPFTQEQVNRLNKLQQNEDATFGNFIHPFTCPNAHNTEEERVLVATLDGWHCSTCEYTQDWAHDFMMK